MLKKNLNFGVTILTFITGKFNPRPLTSCLLFTNANDQCYGGFVLKNLNKQIYSSNSINMKNRLVQHLES